MATQSVAQRIAIDVLVVGAGPVGLAVALALENLGVATRVVDRAPSLNADPRAVHFDGETMRFFQTLGVADAMAALSLPIERMEFVDEQGELLFQVPFGGGEGPQAWAPAQLFHQPDLERTLHTKLAEVPGFELSLATTLVDLEQDDDRVVARVSSVDGDIESIACRYVVGCDGAGSTVRKLIGAGWEDLGPAQPWLVVDGRLLEDTDGLPDVPQQRPWPHRPQFFMRNVDQRVRWEFRVMPDDDPETMVDPATIHALLSTSVDPGRVDIERAKVYTFRSLLATRWRSGRVLLAGDAAHLQPPFMAQGLCSGLRDAANLSWKIGHALRTGDAAILDSYETERRPHAAAWVTEATRVAELCQEIDAREAATRNEFLRAHASSLAPLIPGLGHGLHGERPAPAGTLAAQPRLADGRRMDDAVGRGFALIHAAAAPLPDIPCHLVVLDAGSHPRLADVLTDLAARYAVVRPDRYLLGVANDPEDLADLLAAIP